MNGADIVYTNNIPVHELDDGTLMVEAYDFHHIPKAIAIHTGRVGDHNFIQLTNFSLQRKKITVSWVQTMSGLAAFGFVHVALLSKHFHRRSFPV